MYVAMVSYADDAGTWRCHGWQTVQPYSTKNIELSNSTGSQYVYLYAYTRNQSFSGYGYPQAISRHVTKNKFDYYDGESCPDGDNRRQVYFAKYEIVGGRVDFEP
jgi:Protein of unknown function (DUF1036).